MAKESIALLGLGTMGTGMATNLLKAGFELSVYNRTRAKAETLGSEGARIGDTPAAAAKDATIILSMLADDTASRETWLGEDGALNVAASNAILVECGTVSPTWIAELGEKAHARGIDLLDAPVTGSRLQAAGGQLTFLVGGETSTLDRAMPILQAMSKQVVHLGPLGSGAKIKLVNNFLCGVQAASLAEGMAWLERSGLDRDLALDILKRGAPGSPLLADISGRMTRHDYTVNFVLKLMLKDLQYAHDAAAQLGVDLTTATNARALFEQAAADGYSDQDMSSVVEPLRRRRKPEQAATTVPVSI